MDMTGMEQVETSVRETTVLSYSARFTTTFAS